MREPVTRRDILSRFFPKTRDSGPSSEQKLPSQKSTNIANYINPSITRRSMNWLLAMLLLKPKNVFADDKKLPQHIRNLQKYALVDSNLEKAKKLVNKLVAKGQKTKTIDHILKELDKGTPVVCGAIHNTVSCYKFLQRNAKKLKLDVFFEEYPKDLNVTFFGDKETRKVNYQEAFDLWMYYAWKDNLKYSKSTNFKIVEKAVQARWKGNPPRFSDQDDLEEEFRWKPSKVPVEIENKLEGWGRYKPQYEIAAFEALIKAGTRIVCMDYRGSKHLKKLVAKKYPALKTKIESGARVHDQEYEDENDSLMANDVFKELQGNYYTKEKRKPRIMVFLGRAHTTENAGAKYRFNRNLIQLLNQGSSAKKSKKEKPSDKVFTVEFTTDSAKGAHSEKRRWTAYDIGSIVYALRDLSKKDTPMLALNMKDAELVKTSQALMKNDESSKANFHRNEGGYLFATASPNSKVSKDLYSPRCDLVHIEAKKAAKTVK